MFRLIKGIIKTIIRLAVLAVIIAGVVLGLPLLEATDDTGLAADAVWMSALPDELPVNRITLPGTHDSATKFCELAFFSRCQGMSIEMQLERGFRFLDIRAGTDDETQSGALKLMHGFTVCKTGAMPDAATLYLDDVLSQCYTFLSTHRSEAVIMAIKQEHGDESTADFERLLYSYVSRNPEYWCLQDTIPTLGEARGRIVLMRRYEDEAEFGAIAGLPLIWPEQAGQKNAPMGAETMPNGAYMVTVQERYEYGNEDKWAAFTDGMRGAASEAAKGNIALSFLSTRGTFAYGHPYLHAMKLNARFRNSAENLAGWIVFDFGDASLARLVYESNFK